MVGVSCVQAGVENRRRMRIAVVWSRLAAMCVVQWDAGSGFLPPAFQRPPRCSVAGETGFTYKSPPPPLTHTHSLKMWLTTGKRIECLKIGLFLAGRIAKTALMHCKIKLFQVYLYHVLMYPSVKWYKHLHILVPWNQHTEINEEEKKVDRWSLCENYGQPDWCGWRVMREETAAVCQLHPLPFLYANKYTAAAQVRLRYATPGVHVGMPQSAPRSSCSNWATAAETAAAVQETHVTWQQLSRSVTCSTLGSPLWLCTFVSWGSALSYTPLPFSPPHTLVPPLKKLRDKEADSLSLQLNKHVYPIFLKPKSCRPSDKINPHTAQIK